MPDETRFDLLGPLLVRRDGLEVPIGADQERILLAVLALQANTLVGVDELVNWLWPQEPPRNPRAALQNYVWRLRQKIGGLTTRPQGYVLHTTNRDVDEFRALVAEAGRAGNPVLQSDLLRRALTLWRGQILVDVPSDVLHRDFVPSLTDELLTALSQRIEADLAAGRHTDLVPELRSLVAEHPLREGFWGQLMLTLYRDGRQADALATYRKLSRLLAEELGIDPSPPLQTLHEAILKGDVALGGPPPSSAATGPWQVQRQLPLEIADFVGRAELIDEIAARLTGQGGTPVVALSGLPGVGKTALALRVAHQLADQFPDGQWHVPLGGAGEPRDPAAVLAEMLRASGIPGDQMPEGLTARSAALRARLADRQVLLLLDDAADVEQVLPLLPGTQRSSVLVTSRQELAGLSVRFGAYCPALQVLLDTEASTLVGRLLGSARASAEPAAVAELVELCGRLPLALRLAAANLARRVNDDGTSGSVGSYVEELRGAGRRLTQLAIPGDHRVGVRATFDLSYQALPDADRRLFRLLGMVPGPDLTASAAAALAETDPATAAETLVRLAQASLVNQHRPGRYQLHDLLKLYALELAEAEAGQVDRLLEFYVVSAANARKLTSSGTGADKHSLPHVAHPDVVENQDEALVWLENERANLFGAARSASERHNPIAWQLAEVLYGYFYYSANAADMLIMAQIAHEATQRYGTPPVEARIVSQIATAYAIAGDREEAIRFGEEAAALSRKIGDDAEEASVLNGLGDDYVESGRPEDAVRVLTRAVELSRRTGLKAVEANSVNNLGNAFERLGRADDAIRCYTETVAAAQELGRPDGVLMGLLDLGSIHWHTGKLGAAVEYLEQSIAQARHTTYKRPETIAHLLLARVFLTAGRLDNAEIHAKAGFEQATQIEAPDLLACANIELGSCAMSLGRLGEAIEHYTEALHLAAGGVSHRYEAEARLGLAYAYLVAGRPDTAHQHADQAAAVDRALPGTTALCLTVKATILAAEGRAEEAAEMAQRALTAHERCGFRIGEALTLQVLAQIHGGDYVARAAGLYREIGMPLESARAGREQPSP